MHCGACVGKVQKALAALPGVTDVQVTLSPPQAVVSMLNHVPTSVFNAALKEAGTYSLSENESNQLPPKPTQGAALPIEERDEDRRSFWQTYKPLFIVVGFILGGVLLREYVAEPSTGGRWQWHPMMTNFMGGFFVVFAFFKLLDVSAFAAAYSSYDLISRKWFGYGYIYPFIELLLGLLFLSDITPILTNSATVLIMTLGVAGVWQSLQQKRSIQCVCLGTVFNLPMSTVTLLEDGSMALMSAVMLLVNLFL